MLNSFLRPDASQPASKPDQELHDIINSREKYLPESVEGAVAELQNRGVEFSDEELTVINEDMQARRELSVTRDIGWNFFDSSYQNNIVEDPDAYIFYSRRVIKVFAILLGAFFGSIMLAINIGKTKNTTGVFLVVLFGIFFTSAQVFISESAHLGSSFTIMSSLIGAYCLDYFFWNRYIGGATLYKAKPYWIPLTIGLVIVALLLCSIFFL